MQALNRAIEDASDFSEMLKKLEAPAEQVTKRDIDAEVAAWNARVDRENFEKARHKEMRRSYAERMR